VSTYEQWLIKSSAFLTIHNNFSLFPCFPHPLF
jgi:hypothetical protein